MKRGFHWLAQMPDGKYVILYADPILKTIHRQIGLFEDAVEARAFARKSHITLDEPPEIKIEERRRKDNIKTNRIDALGEAMKDGLADLFAAHPEGIGVNIIQEKFNADYGDILAAVRWLSANKHAEWRRVPGGSTRKFLFPLGVDDKDVFAVHDGMTTKQKAIFDLLCKKVDSAGFVTMTNRVIAIEAGVPNGSVPHLLHELCRKQKIEVASIGFSTGTLKGGVATTFRIPSKSTSQKKQRVVFHRHE